MSHPPYMPLWIGDYLRDTQHLTTEQHGAYLLLLAHCWQHGAIPPDDIGRAQITRLITVKRWNAIKAAVLPFFEPDGTHRRVTKERGRAEHLNTVRSMAGYKGGIRSGISRAKQTGSKSRGPPKAIAQANSQPNGTANSQAKTKLGSSISNQDSDSFLLTSSESVAARAREGAPQEMREVPETQDKPAGELATALRGGALTRPPDAEPAATPPKPPSELTRAELEATFERRRASDAAAAAERTRRVWGRSQPPPPAGSNAGEKQEPQTTEQKLT